MPNVDTGRPQTHRWHELSAALALPHQRPTARMTARRVDVKSIYALEWPGALQKGLSRQPVRKCEASEPPSPDLSGAFLGHPWVVVVPVDRFLYDRARVGQSKDPIRNTLTILTTDASRAAALFVAYILPVCALLTPCRTGASTSRMVNVFLIGS